MFTSKQIRSSFIDFFKDKGHKFVPSAPVVPTNDATLLFTNAGMNQFKDIFLGLSEPECSRAANSQKCIRVSGKHNDLEEVGLDTYHHTFFEMLGNWSFGDYFKEEAIAWAWELLTEVYGIDQDKLWATVFAGDAEDGSEPDVEAEELWAKLTPLPKERILRFDKKDNFWEMGDTGPCGPCSEIHIDLGPERCDKKHVPGHECAVNAGCARFIELWNLVFIQFNRQPDGKLLPLKAKYVDTGAGLERLTALLQNKHSNYDTDLFMPIIEAVQDITGHKYGSALESKTDNAFRVISDHIRSLTFSITDGVTPSNEGRGYVMRRILRRASRFARVLDAHEPFMYKLVDVIVENMGEAFPELVERKDFVKTVIKSEEESFGRTLDRGLEIFSVAASEAEESDKKTVSGENAFQLYDTYGFPLDLTELMARERGLKVDTDTFDELMEQQRARARAAQKTGSLAMDLSGVALPVTEDDAKYEHDSVETEVVGWIDRDGYKEAGVYSEKEETIALVLKETCFYAESGGQVGDAGLIVGDNGRFEVETTEKIANCVIHKGTLVSGSISVGDKVSATVDHSRNESKKNHTATHLLQWALREVLGKEAQQQGSLVCPEYLRFDFTWPKALTDEQIRQIDSIVRDKIVKSYPVGCKVLPIDQAKDLGAMALFSEKYGDEVRVVGVGVEDESQLADAFSLEFCGGTHVTNTSQIGGFKIVKEESISAGVRRITAMTGHALTDYLAQRSDIVDELTALLKTPAEQVTSRVQKLQEDNKKLAKDLKNAAKKGGTDTLAQADDMLKKGDKIGDTAVVVGSLDAATVDQARQAVDSLKKKAGSVAVLFGLEQDSKAILLAAMTDDLIKHGLKAGDLIKEVAPLVKGGGGGRPQMAQAGGKDPSGLPDAYEKAKEIIAAKLK
ncbi:Alanine--tRNA ligase [Anaerohalosphaera lusitana]|uniref:Alanine--tRNA ligase n=1 Tax=Anaerohalosphaera lusitana TaxID=1936003 RepID=A0A1U9NKD3_9BACT|nr:alanine--tRNA ligase [Anaerohalosphaera lusitana]AQT68359.1 Alanine--tRNA ligase [Anaerohalosphaera lusitana]